VIVGNLRVIARLLAASIAFAAGTAHAQPSPLVLDGSLGPAGEIAPVGDDFEINDEHGVFSSGYENRFHSFSQFNLPSSNQNAIFSSSAMPQRVIVRVTSPSFIQGTLRSTIPGADLFFLNPFGVFFGPDAAVEFSEGGLGSFYASTADVLQFADGIELPTGEEIAPPVLSATAPAAFRFSGADGGRIDVAGTQGLTVPEGETLSFVAGQFTLASTPEADPALTAPGATVQIGAVGGPADVPVDLATLDADTLPPQGPGPSGEIVLIDASIDVGTPEGGTIPAGQIVIRGGSFQMEHSNLAAVHKAPGTDAASVGIDVGVSGAIEITNGSQLASASESDGFAGDIRLAGDRVEIRESQLASESRGAGAGGGIEIDAGALIVSNAGNSPDGAFIATNTIAPLGGGAGGNLSVRADTVDLVDGGQLFARTEGSGNAGDLVVEGDIVHLSGIDPLGRPSGITGRALEAATGTGGDLTLQMRVLDVEDGAQVSVATFGAGDAGNLSIVADESVSIRGGPQGNAVVSAASRIQAGTPGLLGQSGDLTIDAPRVILSDGGQASVSTGGTLSGGDLTIRAGDVTIAGTEPGTGEPAGVFAQSNSLEASGGDGGDIAITATGRIEVANGGRVSAQTRGGGRGGSIALAANGGIAVRDGGEISARSIAPGVAGDAGDIVIDAGPRLEVVRASIDTESRNASGGRIDVAAHGIVALQDARISTSVRDGGGGGGDVNLARPEFVILNRGEIAARAVEGPGGNIRIATGTFLASPDSAIDASSALGIDGRVVIDSPNPELTGKLATLPQEFLDSSDRLADPCLARSEREGSFVVGGERLLPPPDAPLSLESGAPSGCAPEEDTP
jgi:filamentous hemagglutinin family protein